MGCTSRARVLAAVAGVVVAAVLALTGVRAGIECARWQGRYERLLYSEMMKNTPVLLTPERLEELIGVQPPGCDAPPTLSQSDSYRYYRELFGTGP